MFNIRLTIGGSLKPGLPIHIQATAGGLRASSDAEINVSVPEIEAARRSEFGAGFRVQVGERLPPLAAQRQPVGSGQHVTIGRTIRVPAPGYYRVVAWIYNHGAEPSIPSQPYSYVERWMWIADEGGQVTERFDETLFPEDAFISPGPLRFYDPPPEGWTRSTPARPDRVASLPERMLRGLMRFVGHTPLHAANSAYYVQEFEVLYYHIVDSTHYAIPYARAEYGWTDWGDPCCPEEMSDYEITDANGEFIMYCPTPDESDYLGDALAKGSDIQVLPSKLGDFRVRQWDCNTQSHTQIITPDSDRGHAYVSLVEIDDRAESKFGKTNAFIEALLEDSASSGFGYSTYHLTGDSLSYLSDPANPSSETRDHIWFQWGTNVLAHEFGHAYQYRTIENWDNPGGSAGDCTNHDFGTQTSLYCAFTEGFAEFFSAWIAGPELDGSVKYRGSDDQIETNPWKDDGGDGAIEEGRVAGFLYDLVDKASDPDGSSGSDDDGVSCPGSFIADVIKTTQLSSPTVTQLGGIDQFVYGAEGDLDAESVGSSNSNSWRTEWETVTVSHSAPASCTDSVRVLWLRNLFDQ